MIVLQKICFLYNFLFLFLNLSNINGQVIPAPSPTPIVYPTLYYVLYPKRTITIGLGTPRSDLNIGINNGYTVLNQTMEYLSFIGGGNVILYPGTYVIDGQVALPSNIQLIGSGVDKTILKLKEYSLFFSNAVGNQGFIKASQLTNVLISNLTLDGNRINQIINTNLGIDPLQPQRRGASGISTIGSISVNIINVRTSNFQGYGMIPHGYPTQNVYGKFLNIQNCISDNNGLDGFSIYLYKNVTMLNNTAYSNDRHGFSISYDTHYLMFNNNSAIQNGFNYPGATGCGIQLQDGQNGTNITTTSNIIINSTYIFNSSVAGICYEDVFYIQAMNNNILVSPQCMIFKNTTRVIANNNTCIKTATQFAIDINSQIIQYNNIFSQSLLNQPPLILTAGYDNTSNITLQQGSDVSHALQDALDAIAFNGIGTLKLSKGLFILGTFLSLSSYTNLIGQGMHDTVLKLIDNSEPFIQGTKKFSGVVHAYNSDNIIVANLTIDGNKVNQLKDELHSYGKYGFYIQACVNITTDGVRVTNFQAYGFDPHGWKNAQLWGQSLNILNCLSDNNDWDGYALDQTDYINVVNSTAMNNGRHGFNVVTGSKYVWIKNCTAENNGFYYPSNPTAGGCGVIIQNGMNFGTGYAIVEDVYVRNSTRGGLCANDVFQIEFRNNTVNNASICMNFVNLRESSVHDNLCSYTNSFILQDNVQTTNLANNTWIQIPIASSASIINSLNLNIILIAITLGYLLI
jgi:hypothetical protein